MDSRESIKVIAIKYMQVSWLETGNKVAVIVRTKIKDRYFISFIEVENFYQIDLVFLKVGFQ